MTVVIVGLGLAVFALVLVGLVIAGTQREAPWSALETKPPTPLAGFARSVLGLHVRKSPTDRTLPVAPRSADDSPEALTSLSPRR
ncbi:hypothetical protein GCM10027176_20240 [Actinoallomurus bryophytorum]|uniref:Uncharacterized protein n=1 Tax=Actinoallomurus bryophytorum TaxID=1490222 RepID=A0A543CKU3_9ACTN|nr:hypothetical protein [Actinoallomurus bryophytorum]TQL97699.1 hypothetical protein FB559_3300 [Actinoallomurus bryophytorum]